MCVQVSAPPSPLSRETIVQAAITLMDEAGLNAVTTRKVAERLGVRGPALYWHIGSMVELRGLMCETVIASALDRVTPSPDWRLWLVDHAVQARVAVNALRDGGRLVAHAQWTERTRTVIVQRQLRPLLERGVDEQGALNAIATMNSYALGWVLMEQYADRRAFLDGLVDRDRLFLEGATALVRGLEISAD